MRRFVLPWIVLVLGLSLRWDFSVRAQAGYYIPTPEDFPLITGAAMDSLLVLPGLTSWHDYHVEWSPDGSQVTVVSGSAPLIYDVSDFSALPQRVSALYAENSAFIFHPTRPDIGYLATKNSFGDAYIAVIDMTSGATSAHFDCVAEFTHVSPNGQRMLTSGQRQMVIYDLVRNQRQLAFDLIYSPIGFSDRGVYIFDTSISTLEYRDLIGNSLNRLVDFNTAARNFPALSADFRRYAAVSTDGLIYVFDISQPDRIRQPFGTDDALAQFTVESDIGSVQVALNSDGTVLASSDGLRRVRLADIGTNELHDLTPEPFEEDITGLFFQPGGSLLAVRLENGAVQIWDWQRGALVAKLGSEFTILGFWFDTDSQPIAYINYQGVDTGWNLLTSEVTALMAVPMLAPETSAISPDGSVSATVAEDGIVTITGGSNTQTFYATEGDYVTFSPDGKLISVWGSSGVLLLRALTDGEAANPTCAPAG